MFYVVYSANAAMRVCQNLIKETTISAAAATRGGSKGGAGEHVPQSPKYYFTNIILHHRVLFYQFTDMR